MPHNEKLAFALSMTVLWSIAFANALHDVTTGICLGLCMGMAFGLFDRSDDAEDVEKNRERHGVLGIEWRGGLDAGDYQEEG